MSVRGIGPRAGALALGLTCALAAFVPAGCASGSAATDGRVQVVTSTNVYGAIVRAIAGSHADVTSLIDNQAQDPHSFEASARDQLAVSRADIIVENGGGYDDFMNRLRDASGKPGATTLDVVALSGHKPSPSGQLNEHVWYDFRSVARFVARLVDVLSAREPAHTREFRVAAASFTDGLHALEATESALRARYAGTPVAITEPLPVYLLRACGLVNRTPPQFSDAIDGETDVPPLVLEQTLALFDNHAVRVLVYNAQTTGAATIRVLATAHADGIPAVPVTETQPAGTGYLSWMRGNLVALEKALAQ
jgi:zinc/manganese transport system substrate-binding protein